MPSAAGEIDRPVAVVTDRQMRRRPVHRFPSRGTLPGREQVEATTVVDASPDPWRWICSLQLVFSRGWKVGTGFLVAPRLLLTAAHNLFEEEKPVASVRIRPGQTDSGAYLAEATVAGGNAGCLAGFSRCGRDLGWIVLDRPFDAIDGFMPCRAMTAAEVMAIKTVNVCGYPDEYAGSVMEHGGGAVHDVRGGTVYYAIDTLKGQSGSPIWAKVGDRRFAVCVYAYGYHRGDDERHRCITRDDEANAGPLLNDEIMAIVDRFTAAGSA